MLPFLLAGPILRRVESRLITVWVACSEAATIQLSVWDHTVDGGSGTSVATNLPTPKYQSQPKSTIKFGDKLHVLAITIVVPLGQQALSPGIIYAYNVSFDVPSGTKDLKSLGLLTTGSSTRPTLPLGYTAGFLPTFILPAPLLEKINIAHGSCRKAHGPGRDGLAALDYVFEDYILTKQQPLQRPQQLFLTGDQIYADDVAAALIRQLNPLGNELIGKPETLFLIGEPPEKDSQKTLKKEANLTLANFPAFSRQKLMSKTAKFTGEASASHLIGFGEYCMMYLLSWSNSAWPAELMTMTVDNIDFSFIDQYDTMPEIASFLTQLPDDKKKRDKQIEKWRSQYKQEVENLIRFRDALPRVQRVLANVATYMILDDHEITDDWYLTKKWRRQVLTNPLGVSTLRNGLLAYAIFQDWGNDPQAYLDATTPKNKLLNNIRVIYDKNEAVLPKPKAELDEVHQLLGFNTDDAPPVRWSYRVPTGPVTTFVLDTRTRRGYDRAISPPALLSDDAFGDQLTTPFALQNPEAVIVVSAAPVLGMAAFEELIQPLYWGAADGRPKPDFEAWAFNPPAFEKLLAKLAPFKKAIILSGDVHFSSSIAMDYWTKTGSGTYEVSKIIQLVASSFKNQTDMLPSAFFVNGRINQLETDTLFPGRRLGWNSAPTINGPLTARNKIRLRKSPVLLTPGGSWAAGTTISEKPDWVWRFRPLLDERPEADRPASVRVEALANDDIHADPNGFYPAVLKRHMDAFKKFTSRRYVWLNNVGIVSFKGTGISLSVIHTLWHNLATDEDKDKPDAYTEYTTPLQSTSDGMPTLF